MSVCLAIDTSGRGGAVAVARHGRVTSEVNHDPAQGFAESLFELCDEALAHSETSLAEVESVAVVRGPGSFTGLRIGVMTAKALAYAQGCPLYAADTLALLADVAGASAASVLAVFEAGRGHAFVSRFDEKGSSETNRVAWADLASWVNDSSTVLAHLASVPEDVFTTLPSRVKRVSVPTLASVLAVGVSEGRGPAEAVEPFALVPVYAGRSQAERVHGLDLQETVHRPVPPTEPWE